MMAGLLAKARYPLVRGMVSYALIWPTCSVVQEYIEHGTSLEDADWERAARFGIFGTFFMAPVFYGWMKYTSRFFKKKTLATAMTRAAIEQVSYSPLAMAYFFFGMTALEFKPLQTCIDEVKLKFWPTYKYGVIFWPMAQTFNFYFISERNRIIFVSAASFVWTVYLAHMKAQEQEPKSDDQDILKGEMLMGVSSSSVEGLKTSAALEGVKTVATKEGEKSAADVLKTVKAKGVETDWRVKEMKTVATQEEYMTMLESKGEEAAAIQTIQEVEARIREEAEDIAAVEELNTLAIEEETAAMMERIMEMEATIEEGADNSEAAEGVKTVVTEGVKMVAAEAVERAVIESLKAAVGEGVKIKEEGVSREGVQFVAGEEMESAVTEGV